MNRTPDIIINGIPLYFYWYYCGRGKWNSCCAKWFFETIDETKYVTQLTEEFIDYLNDTIDEATDHDKTWGELPPFIERLTALVKAKPFKETT